MGKVDQHALVQEYRRVAAELGHEPSRREWREHSRVSDRQIRNSVGSFGALKAAVTGVNPDIAPESPAQDPAEKAAKKFLYVPPKFDPHAIIRNTHTLDLVTMFERAGNPEVLKTLIMPDVHVEHMDEPAVNCFLDYASHYKPHVFIDLGDFLNAGGLSHWGPPDRSPQRIVPEIKRGRELLDLIDLVLPPGCQKIFLEGNHEDWIEQFLMAGALPQLMDGIEDLGYDISTKGFLQLEKRGYQFFKINHIIVIGKAGFTHGMFTGDNHPKQHLLKAKFSLFYGHTHDDKAYVDTSIFGPVEAQSMNCLCDLNPSFLRGRLNNWRHGFGQIEFLRDGSFHKTTHVIRDGKLAVNGFIFKG